MMMTRMKMPEQHPAYRSGLDKDDAVLRELLPDVKRVHDHIESIDDIRSLVAAGAFLSDRCGDTFIGLCDGLG